MTLLQIAANERDDTREYYVAIHARSGTRGVVWDDALAGFLVTSYGHCATALRSESFGRLPVRLPRGRHDDLVACAERVLSRQSMFQDEAAVRRAHWRERACAVRDADIARLVDDAIGDAPGEDLYADVLQPFASRVACATVGIDECGRRALQPLIDPCVRFFDGKLRGPAQVDGAMYAIVALYDRLLVMFRESTDEYSDWVADAMLTLVAGQESTAYLLATIFLEAPTPPRGAVAEWVTESLRFDSPIQLVGRRALVDTALGDVALPEGAHVYLHVGAANRDPRVFDQPHRFEPGRRSPRPLSFGLGERQCLGRSLATRAASTFLTRLVARGCWFVPEEVRRCVGVSGRGFERLRGRMTTIATNSGERDDGDR